MCYRKILKFSFFSLGIYSIIPEYFRNFRAVKKCCGGSGKIWINDKFWKETSVKSVDPSKARITFWNLFPSSSKLFEVSRVAHS